MNHDVVTYIYVGPVRYLVNYIPGNGYHVLFAITVVFNVSINCMCAMPFVCRYLMVCRGWRMPTRNVVLVYILLMSPVWINFPIRIYLASKYTSFLMEALPENLKICNRADFFVDYRALHITDPYDLLLNRVFVTLNFFTIFCYIIVFILGFLIRRFLIKNKEFMRNRHLQRQIDIALIVQALIPFVIGGITSFVGQILLAIMGPSSAYYRMQWATIRFLVPLMNPIVTIWFIRPYRKAFLRLRNGFS
ncbi:hypothetical protein M3Y97_00949800 [Aphelenchoides bicaudatus]|nr:hypothetical protein M3Y97_00949800 [Aphelenchoides bicaudatus]